MAQRSQTVLQYLAENALPFDILLDDTRDVSRTYGVWHRVGLDAWNIARPAVFLIDRDATIRYRFVAARQDEFPEHDEISRELDKVT